jgi:hypothetical protein
MSTNGTLQLATNYVQNGLGTLTFTVPATLPQTGLAVANVPFQVNCQVTLPQWDGGGFGAGSGADQGLGAMGGSTTYAASYLTTGAQQGLGNGALGLGFGGTATDNASGNGSGYGAGSGGGALGGFSLGGGGLGDGATGEAFGAANSGYNQPSAYTNTPTSYAGILSQLSIVVQKNGSTVYTAPTVEGIQKGLQFSTSFLCNASDSVTVAFTSSQAADEALNVLQANVNVVVGEA